jgi:uncharacterized protein (DUF849 family)
MSVEERLRPASTFLPEVASLNMGSMNFGLFPMLQRHSEFKYAWEPEMLEASRDLVFRNSFKEIEYVLTTMSKSGTRFEFECYDTSHLYNLHHFLQRGLVKPPLFVQTVAETNAQQVTAIRKVIEGLGLEIASPDEARALLDLKGGDKVAF